MKTKITFLSLSLFLLLSANIFSQENNFDLKGTWLGKLTLPGNTLRIVFHISEENGHLKATLDSPDQGALGIPVSNITETNDSVVLEVASIGGVYSGKIEKDSNAINGTWQQGGANLPLVVNKTTQEIEMPAKPQEPKKPYPYKSEDIEVPNKQADITLAGTLTLPDTGSNFTSVVLITGSGPQDRNETLMGQKPFLVLSDYLTRHGIAVLRCDDRGTAKSTGNFSTATTKDFVTDALAAVEYLKTRKEINLDKIGLIGHSEGGIIAPMAAVQSKDVAFIILLAAPGIPGDSVIDLQTKIILGKSGVTQDYINNQLEFVRQIHHIIKIENDSTKAAQLINKAFDNYLSKLTEDEKKYPANSKSVFESQIKILLSPWYRFFISYDPKPTLEKVKVPVLALNGSKDVQVPAKEDLKAIADALSAGGNHDFEIDELPNLNHLFQTADTGLPSEYGKLEETFAPAALKTISDWILKTIK
jgi:pimeloyl-ACP methyl ester carboxylesterase